MDIIDFKHIPIVMIAANREIVADIEAKIFDADYLPKHIIEPIYQSVNDFSYDTEPKDWYKSRYDEDDIDDMNRDIVWEAVDKHLTPYLAVPKLTDQQANDFYFYVNGLLGTDFRWNGLNKYLCDLAYKIKVQIVNDIMSEHAA